MLAKIQVFKRRLRLVGKTSRDLFKFTDQVYAFFEVIFPRKSDYDQVGNYYLPPRMVIKFVSPNPKTRGKSKKQEIFPTKEEIRQINSDWSFKAQKVLEKAERIFEVRAGLESNKKAALEKQVASLKREVAFVKALIGKHKRSRH